VARAENYKREKKGLKPVKVKEFKPKTWKQNQVKGHGAIKGFKIHTPTRAKRK
jgi:hypothetical protein